MRVALDCTPLIGRRTGIGTYTANLAAELVRLSPADDWVATAFTFRGRSALAGLVPAGVRVASRPIPARALRAAWLRSGLPPVQALCGGVDVFHGTNFVLPPVGRAAGVVTIHDLAYLRLPQTVAADSLALRRLVPRGLSRAAAVITPSRAVAEQVTDAYRLDEARVHPIHLGVDPSWFTTQPVDSTTRRDLGLPSDYVVAVGTLEPRKNLPTLIDAYRRRADLPPLVLVGGAGWGGDLDLSGLTESQVVLTGHLDFDTLRSVVAGAGLLVMPSLDEGFGLPPLEALACGVPVLVADLPVTHEVLADQATYADATDSEALLDGLDRALNSPAGDPLTRREWASTFTWRRCAERTLQVYRDVAGA